MTIDPGQALTRRRILEAALELVEREGAAALTMRRLANELGAGTMSLYHHVANRDELLDGLSETMVSAVEVARARGDWQDALRAFMSGIRAVAHAHPEAFRLVGLRPLNTPAALPPIEAALAALRAGGFEREAAFYAYRAIVAYARGYALAEIGGFTLEPPAAGEGERLTSFDLPAREFPHIAGLGSGLGPFDRDAAFAFGMEAIIAGLATLAGGPLAPPADR